MHVMLAHRCLLLCELRRFLHWSYWTEVGMSLVAGELAQVLAPSNALIDSVQGHLVVGSYLLILHQVLPILFEHLDSLRYTEPRGTN